MLILTPSYQGHYGYYIDILSGKEEVNILNFNNLTFVNLINKIRTQKNKKLIILNGYSLLLRFPLIGIIFFMYKIDVKQIFYNADIFHKLTIRSILIKLYFISTKILIRNIENFILVKHKKNTFYGLKYLTDPIKPLNAKFICEKSLIDSDFILLFGSHGVRKGTYKFIQKYKGDLNLKIVGKIYDKRILEYNDLSNIDIVDEFVSEEEKNILFHNAAAIAIPYEKWYGSSGVLGHALQHDQVIILSNDGYIAEIGNQYSRSIIINPNNTFININKENLNSCLKNKSNSKELIDHYFNHDSFINKLMK